MSCFIGFRLWHGFWSWILGEYEVLACRHNLRLFQFLVLLDLFRLLGLLRGSVPSVGFHKGHFGPLWLLPTTISRVFDWRTAAFLAVRGGIGSRKPSLHRHVTQGSLLGMALPMEK